MAALPEKPSMRDMRARISGLCLRSKKVTSSFTTMRRSTMALLSLLSSVIRFMLSARALRSIAASSCMPPPPHAWHTMYDPPTVEKPHH